VVEEEVLGETRGGAPRLRVSSGETGGREDFLIQAEPRLPPGRTGVKATQGTILHMAVPEATLDETRPTADPGPHHGKQGCSAELAAQGALEGGAPCQGRLHLLTLTGSQRLLVEVGLGLAALPPWDGKTREIQGTLRAGPGKRLVIGDTGGTTLSGTPDRWANRLLGDPNLPHSNPACRRGSSGAENLRSGILSEMRGETFSLLRGRRTEISTPTEEEAKEDIEEEEKEDIEEEEGRREVSTGEERGSSSGTGEKGNFKPAGLLAGRRETGVRAKTVEGRTLPG